MVLAFTVISCGESESEVPEQKMTTENQPRATSIHPPGSTSATSSGIAFQAYDINGKLRRSDEWIGKQPVVINVWGTWCPPCRKEIPDMVKVYEEFSSKGIEFLGIAVRDTPAKVKRFTESNNMNWVMLMGDPSTLSTMGNITGVPTTIFLDRNGKEVQRFVGPRDYQTFATEVKMLINSM